MKLILFKNKELLTITKNTDILLHSSGKLCAKFQGKWASHSGTAAGGT